MTVSLSSQIFTKKGFSLVLVSIVKSPQTQCLDLNGTSGQLMLEGRLHIGFTSCTIYTKGHDFNDNLGEEAPFRYWLFWRGMRCFILWSMLYMEG